MANMTATILWSDTAWHWLDSDLSLSWHMCACKNQICSRFDIVDSHVARSHWQRQSQEAINSLGNFQEKIKQKHSLKFKTKTNKNPEKSQKKTLLIWTPSKKLRPERLWITKVQTQFPKNKFKLKNQKISRPFFRIHVCSLGPPKKLKKSKNHKKSGYIV